MDFHDEKSRILFLLCALWERKVSESNVGGWISHRMLLPLALPIFLLASKAPAKSIDDAVYACNFMIRVSQIASEGVPEPCQIVMDSSISAEEDIAAYSMKRVASMRFFPDRETDYIADILGLSPEKFPEYVTSEYFNLFVGYGLYYTFKNETFEKDMPDINRIMEKYFHAVINNPKLGDKAKASSAMAAVGYTKSLILANQIPDSVMYMKLIGRLASTANDEFTLLSNLFHKVNQDRIDARALYQEMSVQFGREDWRTVMFLMAINAAPRMPRFTLAGEPEFNRMEDVPSMMNLYSTWMKSDLVVTVPAASLWFVDRINMLYQQKKYEESEVLVDYLLERMIKVDIGAINHRRMIELASLVKIKLGKYAEMKQRLEQMTLLWSERYWRGPEQYIYSLGLL